MMNFNDVDSLNVKRKRKREKGKVTLE